MHWEFIITYSMKVHKYNSILHRYWFIKCGLACHVSDCHCSKVLGQIISYYYVAIILKVKRACRNVIKQKNVGYCHMKRSLINKLYTLFCEKKH